MYVSRRITAILLTAFLALASTCMVARPAQATIASAQSTISIPGNGVQTVFTYPFIIPYQSDGVTPALTVTVTNAAGATTTIAPTGYAVTGVGNATGGTVTYNPFGGPVPTGSTISITRSLNYTQPTAVNNQSFYPHTVEQVADALDMQTQQLNTNIAASVRSIPGEVLNPLPPAANRANLVLGFDSSGQPTLVTGGGGGGGGGVSSVAVSGGSTGLTTSGSPITSSGTITLGGTVVPGSGGTGATATPGNGQLLIGNGTNYTVANISAGSGVTVTNSAGGITIAASGGGSGGLTNTYDITNATYGCAASANTGSADQAPCIQSAINAAFAAGGGIVWVPTGHWNLKTQLTLKRNVYIECAGNGFIHDSSTESYSSGGSVLSVLWGSGVGSGDNLTKAAVLLQSSSGVSHCGIWYPSQNSMSTSPTEYGSTFLIDDANANVHQIAVDNWCANCYNFLDWRGGISGIGMAYSYVVGNTGAPIHYGLAYNFYVDWGVWQNNAFNSSKLNVGDTTGTGLRGWVQTHGIAFYIGASDWPNLSENKAWGYNNGVFIDQSTACCSGFTDMGPVVLAGLRLDSMATADVWVQGTVSDLRITDMTGTAFNTYTSAAGVGIADNTGTTLGSFHMSDSYFFGPMTSIVQFSAAGQSIGNVSLTSVFGNVTSTATYENVITTARSVTILNGTYTGFTSGLLQAGTFTNTPVLIGDYQ